MSTPEGADGGVVVHLVTSLHYGGTERQVAELVRGQHGTRWQPRVVCFRKEGGFLPEVQALGIDPFHLKLKGSLIRPNTIKAVAELASYLLREEARVLHCHDVYSAMIGVPAARLAGTPVVTSRRDLGHHITGLQRVVLRKAMLASTRVLANAATVAAQAEREHGVPADRLIVVPNGLDLTRFDERMRELAAPAAPIGDPSVRTIVTVARQSDVAKGHNDLLEAAVLVKSRVPEARFVLVGHGHRVDAIRALGEKLGVGDIMVSLGDRSDVPAILARADLVCHPARAEGMPNAVLEAMAASRPIVATCVGGTPELMHDGAHGLLVPPRSPEQMANALCALLADPERAARMGAAARARIEARFTIERLLERIDRLYGIVAASAA